MYKDFKQLTTDTEPVQPGGNPEVTKSQANNSTEYLCHPETHQPEIRQDAGAKIGPETETDSVSLDVKDFAEELAEPNREEVKEDEKAMQTHLDEAAMSAVEYSELDERMDSIGSSLLIGEELLPLEFLEEECGVPIRTLRTWCVSGKINCEKRTTKKGKVIYRARVNDVMAYKSSPQRIKSAKNAPAQPSEVTNIGDVQSSDESSESDSVPWEEANIAISEVQLPPIEKVETTVIKEVNGDGCVPPAAPTQVTTQTDSELSKSDTQVRSEKERSVARKCKELKSEVLAVRKVKNSMRKFAGRELFAIMKWLTNRLENSQQPIAKVGEQR